MKKLMIASALVALCGAVMADGIESDNIVGYMGVDKSGNYTVSGSMFLAPGTSTIKLYDIKPVLNGTLSKTLSKAQYITCLQTSSAKTDKDQAFYYYGDKWYYKFAASDGTSWAADAEVPETKTFPAGTAFLCIFGNAKMTGLQYCGEVAVGYDSSITWTKPGNFSFVVNPFPYDITLADVSPNINGSLSKTLSKAQYINFMLNTSAKVDKDAAYYYYSGKWYHKFASADGTSFNADDEVDASTVLIPAGKGFLCAFGNAKMLGLTFTKPAAE